MEPWARQIPSSEEPRRSTGAPPARQADLPEPLVRLAASPVRPACSPKSPAQSASSPNEETPSFLQARACRLRTVDGLMPILPATAAELRPRRRKVTAWASRAENPPRSARAAAAPSSRKPILGDKPLPSRASWCETGARSPTACGMQAPGRQASAAHDAPVPDRQVPFGHSAPVPGRRRDTTGTRTAPSIRAAAVATSLHHESASHSMSGGHAQQATQQVKAPRKRAARSGATLPRPLGTRRLTADPTATRQRGPSIQAAMGTIDCMSISAAPRRSTKGPIVPERPGGMT